MPLGKMTQNRIANSDLVAVFTGEPCDEANPYWWVDCQFVPYDSSQLVVSAGAYSLRTGLTWVQCKGVRTGLITHWQISQAELSKTSYILCYLHVCNLASTPVPHFNKLDYDTHVSGWKSVPQIFFTKSSVVNVERVNFSKFFLL